MTRIPTRDEAWKILTEYNKEEFHLKHACIVEGVMRYFACEYDTEREEFWGIVGLLHDIDFELYPEEHCVKGVELLRSHGVDESIVQATMSHGHGVTKTEFVPQHIMEKILFATDELTGLIGAVAIMRPSGSVQDLELKSVKKKFKQPSFAAGCSREIIQQGADMLEWSLDDLITRTILAMRTLDCVE
ncbi:MAG: hydrolase [Coriobacteriales bacterium]|nr:hydrolase [Coriobacteriales bacterium]